MICLNCECHFKPIRNTKKFCDDSCRIKYFRKRKKNKALPTEIRLKSHNDWVRQIEFYCEYNGIDPDNIIEEIDLLKNKDRVILVPDVVKEDQEEIIKEQQEIKNQPQKEENSWLLKRKKQKFGKSSEFKN